MQTQDGLAVVRLSSFGFRVSGFGSTIIGGQGLRVHDVGGNHGLAVLRVSGFGPIKCRCRVSGLE